jgi:hypothetical protein
MAHKVEIGWTELEGDYTRSDGRRVMIESLEGVCEATGEVVTVFVTTDRSVKALLAQLRDRCGGVWHTA